jgi:ethanolamine transporter EutH
MMWILWVLCVFLAAPLCFMVYRTYQGFTIYNRAVKAFGKDKVVLFNRPYKTFSGFFKENIADGIDSMALYTRELRRNPDIKIFVTVIFQSVFIIISDPEMIRQITNDYSKNN